MKSLDRKLAAIHADPSGAKDFILADAKDADMGFGVEAPGKSPEAHTNELKVRTLADYREQIRQIVAQGIVDIMLMSAHTNEHLTIQERLFENSPITPAGRANDASDVFVVRNGRYLEEPARPFRSASLDHLQCGHVDCSPSERFRGANLGLYSVTFNNRLADDLIVLEEYNRFREEAERKGFRHFLEVFDPNSPSNLSAEQIPSFVNDHIARTLAGVARPGRPVFLKIVYHGPKAMEELVSYDPHLIVGILGGSAGTTYDAFKMLAEAKKYGARAALYGRKINSSEHQLAFVQFLRLIADGEISAEEGVRGYHAVLEKLHIRPYRSLADDMQLQTSVMSYARSSAISVPALPLSRISVDPFPNSHGPITTSTISIISSTLSQANNMSKSSCGCGGSTPAKCACPSGDSHSHDNHAHTHEHSHEKPTPPDFSKMTQAEKNAYHQSQRDRIYGKF